MVGPNNSTTPEIFNYDKKDDISDVDKLLIKNEKLRGIPVKCFSTTSEWATYGPQDFERIRPLTNVDDAVKKLLWVYDNPKKAKQIAKRAYIWTRGYDWQQIARKWDNLFQEAYKKLEHERSKAKDDSSRKAGPSSVKREPAK